MLGLICKSLAWACLLAGLTLPTFAPEYSNVIMLTLMICALVLLWWAPDRAALLRQPGSWMGPLGGLLLLAAFSFTATTPTHVVAAFALIHLYMAGPLAGLLNRLGPWLNFTIIGSFALVGTLGGTAAAAIDVFVFGAQRGGLVNNPIHLADLILALGFVALVGVWGQTRMRYLFLTGPAIAVFGVVLTGSRGPLVVVVLMLALAAVFLALRYLTARRALLLLGLALLVLAGTGTALYLSGALDGVGPLGKLVTALRSGGSVDESTATRVVMYQAALNAFLASPIYGYGLLDYVGAALAHSPVEFPHFEHLHNDIADFAVAGGMLGLMAYALFLLAPLVTALRATGPLRRPLLYLASVTVLGYFGMGMTNAMIGLRWQDIVLVTVTAVIVVLTQRSQEAAS